MTQRTIFDITEKKKLEGIELVWQHADSYWKKKAAEQLQLIINNLEHFTSDDILIPLEHAGITTGDNRAVASLLLAARKLGLIEATEVFLPCRRAKRHGAPVRQWKVVKYGTKKP